MDFLRICREPACCQDVAIGPTAAEIAGHCALDLFIGGCGRALQERFETHNLTRCTKATLESVGLNKRALERVKRFDFTALPIHTISVGRFFIGRSFLGCSTIGQAFNGRDGAVMAIYGEQQTSIHGAAINHYGARATIAHITDLFGAREVKVVAQTLDLWCERTKRFGLGAALLAVHDAAA